MKILLIRPPEIHYGKTPGPSCGIPLGIAYIAAVLKKSGHEVKILDFLVCGEFCIEKTPDGGISYGAPRSSIIKKIEIERPDIVGISDAFYTQFENSVRMAELVKGIDQKIYVAAGGAHPSVRPLDFFEKSACVDAVIVGEGEYAFLELVNAISENKGLGAVRGLVYKKDNKIYKNPPREPIQNLDELPLPAYELLDMEEYFLKKYQLMSVRPVFIYPGSERTINIITSRGCPYDCVFCSIHLTMGYRWRAHSPEYVLNHIKYLKEEFGVRHLHFEDDNLTLDANRLKRIVEGLLKLNASITWDTPNGIRADTLGEEIIDLCKRSGCIYMIIGIESGDQYVLDNIVGKRLSLQKVEAVSKICGKIKLNLEAFFVIGFPGEKKENIKNTLRFAYKLQFKYGVYPILFVATPLPGTRLYEICAEKGYIQKDISYKNTSWPVMETGMFETQDFDLDYIRRAFRRFMLTRACLTVLDFLKFFLFNFPIFVSRLEILIKTKPFKLALRNVVIYKFFMRKIS